MDTVISARYNSIIPMQQYPPNEEVLKSAQTCLAVFADFGTGESFDRLLD